jgi:hypothetical protein
LRPGLPTSGFEGGIPYPRLPPPCGVGSIRRSFLGRERRDEEPHRRPDQPIATMRSIGTRARSAIAGGTLTSPVMSRRQSRSFGSVIIFMYLQNAIRLAAIRSARGAASSSG